MTGAELAANTAQLALAYSRTRSDGTAWLASWRAEKPAAVAELMQWELEGQPTIHVETAVTVLEQVRMIFVSADAWTKGATARNAAGQPVNSSDPTAVAWSLDGAIEMIVGDFEDAAIPDQEAERRHQLELAVFERLGVDPAVFNDNVSFENVQAFLSGKAAA